MNKVRALATGLATTGLLAGVAQTTGASAGVARPNFGDPAWSPNGKLIALSSNRDDTTAFPDIYVMSADGTGMRRVTPGQSECPAFDP
jgi:Tol biopolymer transport system component